VKNTDLVCTNNEYALHNLVREPDGKMVGSKHVVREVREIFSRPGRM